MLWVLITTMHSNRMAHAFSMNSSIISLLWLSWGAGGGGGGGGRGMMSLCVSVCEVWLSSHCVCVGVLGSC